MIKENQLKYIDNINMFFILCNGRSGSTLLRTILDSHPNIQIPLEGDFVELLYKKYYKETTWDDAKVDQFYQDVVTLKKRGQKTIAEKWNMDTALLKENLLNYKGERNYANFIKIIYQTYKSLNHKEEILLTGNKSIIHYNFAEKLIDLYPDVKFIFLIRDPRDCVISFNESLKKPVSAAYVYYWRLYYKKLHKIYLKKPDKFYLIKYEDLVTNPEKYIQEVCNFLGVEYLDNMVNYDKEKTKQDYINQKVLDTIHTNLLKPINKSSIDKWKTMLSGRNLKLYELLAGNFCEQFGYKRLNKSFGIIDYVNAYTRVYMGIIYQYLYNKYFEIKHTIKDISTTK